MKRSTLLLAALWLGACGATDAGGDGDGDGDGDCDLIAIVETAAPEVGSSVVVTAEADVSGFQQLEWAVSFMDQPVTFSDQDPDVRSITFVPEAAGLYRVAVSGTVDGEPCLPDVEMFTVTEPGANRATYRVRMTPPPELGAAVKETTIEIAGGGDYYLGSLGLETGGRASGSVSAGGVPVAAQLRARAESGAPVIHAFAAADGSFDFHLPAGLYDVDVLPADPSIAPLRLAGVSPAEIGPAIELGGADTVTGQVLDPDGAPLAGARVLMRVGGLPSSVGVTDGSGRFSLGARTGAAASIEISPPAGSGLPILEAALADSPGPGSSIDVQYDPGLTVGARSFPITESDGSTPVPGARVVFVADAIAAAGTVSVDGGAEQPSTGRMRVAAIADGAGEVAGLALLDAVYVAVLEPPSGAAGRPARLSVDLSAGGDPAIALAAAPSRWQATIVDGGGAPIAGAAITARPRGAVASLSSATARAESDATGAVSLDLIGAASYALQIDPPRGHARLQLSALEAAPAGAVTDAGQVSPSPTQRVSGELDRAGGGAAARVHLAFFCTGCPTPEVPVAETVTDGAGRFAALLPDAGTSR